MGVCVFSSLMFSKSCMVIFFITFLGKLCFPFSTAFIPMWFSSSQSLKSTSDYYMIFPPRSYLVEFILSLTFSELICYLLLVYPFIFCSPLRERICHLFQIWPLHQAPNSVLSHFFLNLNPSIITSLIFLPHNIFKDKSMLAVRSQYYRLDLPGSAIWLFPPRALMKWMFQEREELSNDQILFSEHNSLLNL